MFKVWQTNPLEPVGMYFSATTTKMVVLFEGLSMRCHTTLKLGAQGRGEGKNCSTNRWLFVLKNRYGTIPKKVI